MGEEIVFVILGLVAWFWFSSFQAKEHAIRIARRLCDRHQVQLLDQTVVQVRIRPRRDGSGRLRWLRDYRFEFTVDGEVRSEGFITLLAQRVIAAQLELEGHTLHDSTE